MQPISSLISGTAELSASAAGVKEPSKGRRPEDDDAQRRPLKPLMDEYIPEEKQEPTGRYWLGRDDDGKPKICFDDPKRAAIHPVKPDELPDTDNPEQNKDVKGSDKKAANGKGESCTVNTDKVDREIEKLKKKKQELEQQINSESDDEKLKTLEKELAQVERELRQKDNDTYRRQHATYSYT